MGSEDSRSDLNSKESLTNSDLDNQESEISPSYSEICKGSTLFVLNLLLYTSNTLLVDLAMTKF